MPRATGRNRGSWLAALCFLTYTTCFPHFTAGEGAGEKTARQEASVPRCPTVQPAGVRGTTNTADLRDQVLSPQKG